MSRHISLWFLVLDVGGFWEITLEYVAIDDDDHLGCRCRCLLILPVFFSCSCVTRGLLVLTLAIAMVVAVNALVLSWGLVENAKARLSCFSRHDFFDKCGCFHTYSIFSCYVMTHMCHEMHRYTRSPGDPVFVTCSN